MADFKNTRIPEDDVRGYTSPVGVSGVVMSSKRLLGDTGASAPGLGQWYRSQDTWKTFMLYALDRKSPLATADVRIEACMELASAPDDPDVDTFVVELAVLNAAAPNFSTEYPWRWIRARVVDAGPTVQVGMHAMS